MSFFKNSWHYAYWLTISHVTCLAVRYNLLSVCIPVKQTRSPEWLWSGTQLLMWTWCWRLQHVWYKLFPVEQVGSAQRHKASAHDGINSSCVVLHLHPTTIVWQIMFNNNFNTGRLCHAFTLFTVKLIYTSTIRASATWRVITRLLIQHIFRIWSRQVWCVCSVKTVWSIPERFRGEILTMAQWLCF